MAQMEFYAVNVLKIYNILISSTGAETFLRFWLWGNATITFSNRRAQRANTLRAEIERSVPTGQWPLNRSQRFASYQREFFASSSSFLKREAMSFLASGFIAKPLMPSSSAFFSEIRLL